MILYKYLSSRRVRALEQDGKFQCLRLRFTQPSRFNDPFECMSSQSFLPESAMPGLSGYGETAAMNMELEHEMSLSHDDAAILCLSEAYDSIVMWAHYAESHTGFVVALDASHEFFQKPYAIRPIQYRETRPTDAPENLMDEMYVKYKAWSYEREWRLRKDITESSEKIVKKTKDEDKDTGKDKDAGKDKDEEETLYFFDIPREAVRCIYFGIKMSEENKERLYRLASGAGVPCIQLTRNYRSYSFHETPYEDAQALQRQAERLREEQKAAHKRYERASTPHGDIFVKALLANCLTELAALLSEINGQIQRTGGLSEDTLAAFSLFMEQIAPRLDNIDCLPHKASECAVPMTDTEYEHDIHWIVSDAEYSIYQIRYLTNALHDTLAGTLPRDSAALSNTVEEHYCAAVSGFASALANAAVYLKDTAIDAIVRNVAFDSELREVRAGKEGFREAKRISAKWGKRKTDALQRSGEAGNQRVFANRMEALRKYIDVPGLEDYMRKYNRFGMSAELRPDVNGYRGPMTAEERRLARESSFAIALIQREGDVYAQGLTNRDICRNLNRMRRRLSGNGIAGPDVRFYLFMEFEIPVFGTLFPPDAPFPAPEILEQELEKCGFHQEDIPVFQRMRAMYEEDIRREQEYGNWSSMDADGIRAEVAWAKQAYRDIQRTMSLCGFREEDGERYVRHMECGLRGMFGPKWETLGLQETELESPSA